MTLQHKGKKETPSVALGLTLLAQALLVATAVGSYMTRRPPAVHPLASGPVCVAPVAVQTLRGPILGCAEAPELAACAAQAGDAVRLDREGCTTMPHAMPLAWRLPLGLRLNVNRATAAQLQALPGVGPATAAAIVATRQRLGPFVSWQSLESTAGLGPASRQALAPLLTLTD